MWITALTNRQPVQVVLVHAQKIDFGIVCQPMGGEWEALFAVRPKEKLQLPADFELSDDAKAALDRFMEIQGL